MNRVLSNKRLYSNRAPSASGTRVFGESFSIHKKSLGPAGKASLSVGITSLIMITFFLGGVYIFQVNKAATQGIDIKTVENKIQNLEQQRKKLEIKEVELKSMYQIEKSTQDLNLVNADAVSYIELDGPVAMK